MSIIPYFGRAWSLAIDTADGNHYVVRSLVADNEEPLRITFAVDTYLLLAYWTASITVYNLSPSTAGKVSGVSLDQLNAFLKFNQPLELGDKVSLSAGYKADAAGAFDADRAQLYRGAVLQTLWEREDVVDFKLTLRCMTGLVQDALNFVSQSVSAGFSAYDSLNQICADCQIPIEEIDDAAREKLENTSFPRGQVFHGRPYEQIRPLLKSFGLHSWVGDRGLNIRSFDQQEDFAPDYVYGPPDLPGAYTIGGTEQLLVKKTLIGTPVQTQKGVIFRVLLDSAPQIGDIVQLVPGTLITPFLLQLPNVPPPPNPKGVYAVVGVRHVGDSRGRGGDWYTEITGATQGYFADFLNAQPNGS